MTKLTFKGMILPYCSAESAVKPQSTNQPLHVFVSLFLLLFLQSSVWIEIRDKFKFHKWLKHAVTIIALFFSFFCSLLGDICVHCLRIAVILLHYFILAVILTALLSLKQLLIQNLLACCLTGWIFPALWWFCCGYSLTSMPPFGFPAGGGGSFVSSSSSTKIVNGKRIVTKK